MGKDEEVSDTKEKKKKYMYIEVDNLTKMKKVTQSNKKENDVHE